MANNNVRFYRFKGVLGLDRQFVWRPGYTTSLATGYHAPVEDSSFAVVLFDEDGKVLLRHPIAVEWGNVSNDPTHAHIRESIPWRAETAVIALQENGVMLFELPRPKETPTVRLLVDLDALSRATGDERVEISWEATGQKPLTGYLSFSADDGKDWLPLGPDRQESTAAVNAGRLPGGAHCRIRIEVSDGVNTAEAISDTFARPEQGPTALIQTPSDGAVVRPGLPLEVRGQDLRVVGMLAPPVSMTWRVDGKFVSDRPFFSLEFPRKDGQHTIELEITDANGLSDRSSHTVTVESDIKTGRS